jgi:hypothetical protein
MKFRERYAEPTIWLLINITLAAGLVFVLSGCTRRPNIPTGSTIATGTDLQRLTAHIDVAEWATIEAKKLVAAKDVAAAYLTMVSHEHGAAIADGIKLAAHNDQATAEAMVADARQRLLEGDIHAMQTSARWKYGGWVVWGIRIIFWWALIVLTFPVLGLLIPPPYGTIIGIIGRALNPLAWGQWYASRVQVRQALYTPVPPA